MVTAYGKADMIVVVVAVENVVSVCNLLYLAAVAASDPVETRGVQVAEISLVSKKVKSANG